MSGPLDPLISTTIAYYARDIFDGVKENFPFWSILKENSAMEYDCGGDPMIGAIEAGRYSPLISAPGMDLTNEFNTYVRHIRYNFPFAELSVSTRLDRGMLRRNSGDQALVDLSKTEIPAMIRDLIIGPGVTATNRGSLAWHILNQNAAAYTGGGLPFYGLPTFLLAPGATGLFGFDGNVTSTGTAVANTDREAQPSATSQTYASLSMAYNGLSASVQNAEPDAWTPTLVNFSSNVWDGTANDQANVVGKVLNWAAYRSTRFDDQDPNYRANFGIFDAVMYRYLGEYLANKQTIYMNPQQSSAMTAPNLGYGLKNALLHAGLMWYQDKNMPGTTAYVINAQQLKLCFEKLFKDAWWPGNPLGEVSGEDAGIIEPMAIIDPITRSYLVNLTLPGQLKANPRYFVRVGNYA